ncbi:MAG: LysR family transcriptional regulator [Pseudomonadota bacterium]
MPSRIHARIGTIRQLEILLAVHDEGGVAAASEALHLTQPTVSMQLKKLAEAVGAPLYQKAGKRLVFTQSGEAVLAAARDVMQRFEALDMQLADLAGLKSGKLRIAVVTTSKYFIPHLLGSFCERYPDVEVQFRVGNREEIIERLHEGKDDLYVFSHPPEEERDIVVSDFLPNPLVAIAPEGHPLTARKSISLRELAEQPLLMREAGSGTRYAIERFFREKGVELDIKMTIQSNEAIKHAVMSGLGLAILSAHTLTYGGRAGLDELQVSGLPIRSRWFLVRPGWLQPSVVAQTFLDYLEGSDELKNLMDELATQMPGAA